MDVLSTASTPTQTQTTAPAAKTSDYQTFLRMLTAQIKNQDPLNPMTSDNFASQLATFSAVEQQTKTNDLLTQQLALNSQNTLVQMVNWVGKEARVAAPAYFDGVNPVTLSPNPAQGADKAVLVVRTLGGTEVSRTQIPVSTEDYTWQARDANGAILPVGKYNISLESALGDTSLGESTVEYFARINELRSTSNGIEAVFDGGITVPTNQVTAVRGTAG